MKWPLNQIKSALDASAQRRDVLDLVQSGTRSVRVISEEKVVHLIEAVVHDALGESRSVDPAERDRLVAQAKSEFARLARAQAETDMKSHRQQETILSFQRRVEDLEREKQRLIEVQRALETQRDEAVMRAEGQSMRAIQAERQLEQAARQVQNGSNGSHGSNGSAAPTQTSQNGQASQAAQSDQAALAAAAAQAAQAAQTERYELLARIERAERAAEAAQAALAAHRAPTAEVIDRTPEGLATLHDDLRQMQTLLARLETNGGGAARDLESRFETAMQVLLDKVGRKLATANARPVETRVEATDALLGKVLEDGSGMESNLHDLDVSERRSDQSIQRSLERLRKARKASPSA